MYKIQFYHYGRGWYDHGNCYGVVKTFATHELAYKWFLSMGIFDGRHRIVDISVPADWIRE